MPDLKRSDTDCLRWAGCEGALKAGGGCDGSTDKDAELRPSTEVTSGEQLPATAATDGPSAAPNYINTSVSLAIQQNFKKKKHDQLW